MRLSMWRHATLMLVMSVLAPGAALADAAQSIVLVNGVRNQPATGVIVGWHHPTLYLVTARHAVIEEGPEGKVRAEKAAITLDASVCGEPLVAKIYADDGESDSAVLAADVESRGCAAGLSRLSALTSSTWTAPTAPIGVTLKALGRASAANVDSLSVVLKGWHGSEIILASSLKEEMSGGPLINGDGFIVGLIRSTSSTEGYATDFGAVMTIPAFNSVPFNLAGKYSYVDLKGYPSETRLTIDRDKDRPIYLADSSQRLNLPAGLTHLELEAPGYEAVEKDVVLTDPGSAVRCVKMVQPVDRVVAMTKWPLVGATAVVGIIAGSFIIAAEVNKHDFSRDPMKADLDRANSDVRLGRGFLIGTAAAAVLTFSAFAWDGFALSPTRKSTMLPCK